MLELVNDSPWQAGLYSGWDRQAQFQQTLVIKAGFSFDDAGLLTPLTPSAEIQTADAYHGEPEDSSLAAADESVPYKEGGEILLTGTAHPPRPGVRAMETELALARADAAPWRKVLRIVGRRQWERRLLMWLPSDAVPLEPLPLRYEYAFGGKDPKRGAVDERNPAGRGYAKYGRVQKDQPLPQIEQGPKFITSGSHQPEPAGYGPLAPRWASRRMHTPTADNEAVTLGLPPYKGPLPALQHNAAPPDQRFPAPFIGGETLRLRGFFPTTRTVELTLPTIVPRVRFVLDNQAESVRPVCDTLLIDTDRHQLHLLWRSGFAWSPTSRKVGWVFVSEPPAAVPAKEERKAS
ncbi:DUF2169 domain-containing protein [Alkalilimnicola ehrlichii]|nr:DUF2169 domain-containing protein [Alkalilimnicola ehrlichii]